MEHKRLGKTGLKVSSLCLGTMTFIRWIDEKTSAEIPGKKQHEDRKS
jgi:aryl-alcohol dehydrogenase-like predicted oxidoreductase